MVDHQHSLVMCPQLQLLQEEHKLLDSKFSTDLNRIYTEGERAHFDNDFSERPIRADFNLACDRCMVEVEFMIFKCLCCRSFVLCEQCWQGD